MRCAPGFAARLAVALVAMVFGSAMATAGGPGCPCHTHGPLAVPAAILDAHLLDSYSLDSCGLDFLREADTVRALRVRLDRDPYDQEARHRLLDVPNDRPLSKESAAYETARAILPARFTEFQTRRFILLSDASPGWTRAQAERLERAHHQFMRFCARLGLEPLPLEHKLVCVLFERRADYRRFAAEHDDVRDEWVAGYYSPRHDRIVFYNVETDPQVENARSDLERMEREMEEIHNRARRLAMTGLRREADRLWQTLARYEEHLSRERGRVDAFTRQVSIATTIHEAVHQLAFHTRIQSPHVQNPLWISEGLATAFETETPNAAFGPEHEYGPRRSAFAELLEDNELLPVAELVSLMNLSGANERRVRTFYHQSYALVTWMSRFRRAEMRDYLELLRREQPGAVTRERQLELFEQAFGAIGALERAWLRHERG